MGGAVWRLLFCGNAHHFRKASDGGSLPYSRSLNASSVFGGNPRYSAAVSTL